jgi:hypothetical protein
MKKITITHNYSGASMLDLLKKYGTGKGGFYSDWWKGEKFAQDHQPAGEYELVFYPKLVSMTFSKQIEKLGKEFEVAHPVIILEAIFSHYERMKKYILDDWYVWTSALVSDGLRVYVGGCDAVGVDVRSGWDGLRYDRIGVGASWKLANQTHDHKTWRKI